MRAMSSPVLARCGISQFTTPTLSAPEAARAYADAGFRSIGAWLHKLERPDHVGGFFIPDAEIPSSVVDEAAAGVRASGLTVSHVVMGGFFITDDEDRRRHRVAYTAHAMDIAAAFGSSCLIIAPGRLEGRSVRDAHAIAARSLNDVLELRPDSDVLLGVEPVINWQSDYMNSIDRALELIELVDHPRLGVYPDNFHLWHNSGWDTATVLAQIERAGPRIVGVHVNDGVRSSEERLVPGDGEMPVAEFVAAVEATGYRGSYDVEYVYDPALITSDPGSYAPEMVVERCRAGLVKTLVGILTCVDGVSSEQPPDA
jgi:sugar phosphate isomerase/epimerase